MPAGVTISFESNTPWFEVLCQYAVEGIPGRNSGVWELWGIERVSADLYCDDQFVDSRPIMNCTSFRFDNLGTSKKRFQLWLPHIGKFIFEGLNIDSDSEIRCPPAMSKPRWITYGSSATQCVGAERPTDTWPAIVSLSCGFELVSLGFGGNCHLDPLIARIIRDQPADVISLCLGANIQIQSSLNQRTFGPGIIGFIKIIRERHPSTPILVLSPIYCMEHETTPNAVGLTMEMVRLEVEKAVKTLCTNGDNHLFYKNGLEVLGSSYEHLYPDRKHPNNEGYRMMAENIEPAVLAAFHNQRT